MTYNMENFLKKSEEEQNAISPGLQEIERETPTTNPTLEIDGNIPESVKDEVNRKIWDRIHKEDHPPERAD